MFNNKIRKSLVASALAAAFALSGGASATELKDLHQAANQTQRASVQSQEKINTIYEQTQELLGEYRQVVDQTDNLKVYNDFLATLVADQQRQVQSVERQLSGLDTTNKGVVPLMFKMIDALEEFVKADVPLKLEDRLARVQRLRDLMAQSTVSRAEQYRLILEAYSIEKDYGTAVEAYQGTVKVEGGAEVTVDVVHVGRLALMAQSLDKKSGWVWHKKTAAWEPLPEQYLSSVNQFIRMARKEAVPEMEKVTVFAAE